MLNTKVISYDESGRETPQQEAGKSLTWESVSQIQAGVCVWQSENSQLETHGQWTITVHPRRTRHGEAVRRDKGHCCLIFST